MAANINLEDIQKLKVADLKKELKLRGLSTAGNKTELIERLQLSYDRGSPSLDNEELLDDDDDELADETLEEDLAAIKAEESAQLSLGVKRKLEVSGESSTLPMKKIVLNRTAVAVVDEIEEPKKEAVVMPEETKVAPKDTVKIGALSTQERLELRANKFGIPLSADAKKEARAARFGISSSATTKTTVTSAPSANVEVLKKRADRFGASVSSTLTKVEYEEKLKKRQERFGVVEPASNGKLKSNVNGSAKAATTVTTTSKSTKVPITMGNAAADEKKKQRAERFKATL